MTTLNPNAPSRNSRNFAPSPAMKTARNASPSRKPGSPRATGSAKNSGLAGRRPTLTPPETLDHAARRIGKMPAHRRPHGFRAERRLARWLPERTGRRGNSPPHQRPIQRQAARHRASRGLGGRRRRAFWQKSVRLVRLFRQLNLDEARGLKDKDGIRCLTRCEKWVLILSASRIAARN